MKKFVPILSVIALVLAGVLVFVASVVKVSKPAYDVTIDSRAGSVTPGGTYQSTTTRNYAGTAMPATTTIFTGSGTLGSVVITGAAAGQIIIYDATSSVTNANWATHTVAVIPASAAAGTYTFDVNLFKGLYVEMSGTIPTSTITYRTQ